MCFIIPLRLRRPKRKTSFFDDDDDLAAAARRLFFPEEGKKSSREFDARDKTTQKSSTREAQRKAMWILCLCLGNDDFE